MMTILLMLSLGACKTIEVGKEPPPVERLSCPTLPAVPDYEPLQAYEVMEGGALIYSKRDVDDRDAIIAEYIGGLMAAWNGCASQLAWHRDYWRED